MLQKLAALAAELKAVNQSLEGLSNQMEELMSRLQAHMGAKPSATATGDYQVHLARWQSVADQLLAQIDLCGRNVESQMLKCSQLMQQMKQLKAQLAAKIHSGI